MILTESRQAKLQAVQRNKIERILMSQGQLFQFVRKQLDKYGQPTKDMIKVTTIPGLFHENTSYLSKSTDTSSTIRRKSSPMILCLLEDAKLLQNGDILEYNGQTLELVELKNVSGMDFAVDLSMEEVQKDVSVISD